MEKNQLLFTMKDVERMTGLSKDTIRNWCTEFNLQLEKTEGGHRRFTEENIQVLKSIEEKKEVNGWSMKQIASWLNGELTPEIMAGTEVKTNLEKKFENLEQIVLQQNELLKSLTMELAETKKNRKKEQKEMIESVVQRLSDPVEHRAVSIVNSLMDSMEQRRLEVAAAEEQKQDEEELHKQKEKLGPISRFLSKFGL